MTLVTLPQCFQDYEFTLIPRTLVQSVLLSRRAGNQGRSLLVRLQCYCEITGTDLCKLNRTRTLAALNAFAAAMFSRIFTKPSTKPWNHLLHFRHSLPADLTIDFPGTWNRASWSSEFRKKVDFYESLDLDRELSEFWQGWVVTHQDGKKIILSLWKFWKIFGANRARQYFNAVQSWTSAGCYRQLPAINDFVKYATGHPDINFEDPHNLGTAFLGFFEEYLRTGNSRNKKIITLVAEWCCFAGFLSDYLLGVHWATPIPAVPFPSQKKTFSAVTNVKTTTAGETVKISLLTPIPLNFSDTKAKELLFHDIRDDVDQILKWARREIILASERLIQRKSLASQYVPSPKSKNGDGARLFQMSWDRFEDQTRAAAVFEKNGFNHILAGKDIRYDFPRPYPETAWQLGLPTPGLVLAHAALLVSEHPVITPSYLEHLEIFDCDGKLVGLHQTDAGWYLRGTKPRRGPRLAQQDILLTAETLQTVRDLIDLTEHLRRWLRHQNNPHWRRLFLVTPSLGTPPRTWSPSVDGHQQTEWLATRLLALANVTSERAKFLATQFSLKRLRVSRAVLIYIETGSVERMADALGHHKWRPSLLDRYLPRPIQEFYTERWIRIFQNGIICEALRESPYLLEASDFQTMDALDEFLEHHALRTIPAHLENPDALDVSRQKKLSGPRVLFGIDVGIVSILMSLISAVHTASRLPCGRAIRWASLGERLIAHLETQTEQPEFWTLVAEARRLANPSKMEEIIYG
jgi:hypothetical protein